MFILNRDKEPNRRHWASQAEYKTYYKLTVSSKEDEERQEQLSRENVLEWFTTAETADGLWVLKALARDHRLGAAADSIAACSVDSLGPMGRSSTFSSENRSTHWHCPEERTPAEIDASWSIGGMSHSSKAFLASSRLSRQRLRTQRMVSNLSLLLNDAALEEAEAREDAALELETYTRLPTAEKMENPAPIVQFSAFRHFCIEGERKSLTIEVTRIGNLAGSSSVAYRTEDGTAQAGITYVATSGVLEFAPAENRKTLEVPLIDDETWNPTSEFVVVLLQEGIQNAVLGRYLWETRVAVMDDDGFPTNRYKAEIMDCINSRGNNAGSTKYFLGKLAGVPKMGLWFEYVKLTLANPTVRMGSVKLLLTDQLHNAYFLLTLFMKGYMVDTILNVKNLEGYTPEEHADAIKGRIISLLLLILVTALPVLLLHYLDYSKHAWGIRSTAYKTLMGAIIRKFLNYSAEVRSDLSQGTLILAMTRDAAQVVDEGYMTLFRLAKSLGSLVFMVIFQFVTPLLMKSSPTKLRYTLLLPICIYPLFLFTFVKIRTNKTLACQEALNDATDDFTSHVDNIILNYQVIADYDRRGPFLKAYEAKLGGISVKKRVAEYILENNAYFATWLSIVVVGLYTLKGGIDVLNQALSLGTFLVDIRIFQEVGHAWGQAYEIVLRVQGSIPRLERVTTLLNFPIDLPERMALSNHRRHVTKKLRAEIFSSQDCKGLAVDMLPIRIGFVDPSSSTSIIMHSISLEPVASQEISLTQARLIFLLGPHAEGKSYLLRLLSGAELPRQEDDHMTNVFVPSHLRTLHVSAEPIFFEGTLYDNLTLGVREGDTDGSMERVVKICRRLGLPRSIIAEFVQEPCVGTWSQKLSQTQRQLLSLARAFITNPEFLCLQKPVQMLDEYTADKVLLLLREFVDEKGLEQHGVPKHMMRPRTCIMTSNRQLDHKLAHTVVRVSDAHGIVIEKDKET